VEGPTDDPAVERLRNRQVKNHLTLTLISLGVPMILMGDEVRRTQNGNNNAYCLDDETSWFDWTLLKKYSDVHRFVAMLNARRLQRDFEHERTRLTLNQLIAQATKTWHGVTLGQPDWGENSHSVALTVELRRDGRVAHIILNAYREPLEFELPPANAGWRRWIDTSLDSPNDITDWQSPPEVQGTTYLAADRSVVVLLATITK
jgi:glycogen operon protein